MYRMKNPPVILCGRQTRISSGAVAGRVWGRSMCPWSPTRATTPVDSTWPKPDYPTGAPQHTSYLFPQHSRIRHAIISKVQHV